MVLRRREIILFVLVAIAVVVWIFDRFYYFPKSRQISRLKEEVKAADLKLNEISTLTNGVDTVEAEIIRLEKELKMLSERTLKGEEFRTFLKHLARESDPLHLKVVSLVPQEEILPLPEGKKGTSAFPTRRVTVQMVLHSTYHKLGSYLKGIEELPFLVSINHLQVEKNEEILPLLKVTMGLNMYMVADY